MLKREWSAESNAKRQTYSISGKTAALVLEFAVEDLPSAELQPRFLRLEWRTCSWAEHSDDDDDDETTVNYATHATTRDIYSIEREKFCPELGLNPFFRLYVLAL